MVIKINYTSSDVYVSTSVSPVYVVVNYSAVNNGGGAIWGGITGTLSDQTDLQNALDDKVPYTGAIANVDLGEYELKAGQLTLDVSPTGTAAVGTTRWNNTIGSSETTLKGGSVILKNGVDLVARIVNKVTPNTTLTKAAYQAVRVSGAQGQRLAVAFAQANNDANSADTIGLVTETIPTNQEGFIITVGQIENINTTGSLQGETWVDGDVLYLSPTTPGAITKVKPTGAGHIVVIGYVEYAHANNGKIYVKVMNGWELDELHDVSIVSPANNEALIYESSTSLWKNKTIASALGYTPVPTTRTLTINGTTFDLSANRSWTIAAGITGSGVANQLTYWNGTGSVTGSAGLTYVDSTGILGLTKNQNAATSISITNTNNNANSDASLVTTSNSGQSSFGKMSTGRSYKIIAGGDAFIYNATGDLAIQNDIGGGKIKFASGNSSTAHMTLTSAGRLLLGTTTESTFIFDAVGTARVTGDMLVNGITVGKGGGNVSSNTALGGSALLSNTTGFDNSAFGASSLRFVTTGLFNSAFGSAPLYSLTTGIHNSAFGYVSLFSAIGSRNSAFGSASLYSLSSGNDNTALGNNAGRYIAGGSTANTTSGTSIFIGSDTKALADNQTNQIVIGYNTTGLGSNTTVIGNSSTTDTAIYGRMLVNYSSPVIGTFALDVNGTARVSGALTFSGGTYVSGETMILKSSIGGLLLTGSGSSFDIFISNKNGADVLSVATGTQNVQLYGALTLNGNINNGNFQWTSSTNVLAITGDINATKTGTTGTATLSTKIGTIGGIFRAYGSSFAVSSLASTSAFGPDGASGLVIFTNASATSGGTGSLSIRGGGYDSGAEILFIDKDGAKYKNKVNYVPMSTPATANAGDVYYDSSTNKLRCYNGTSWNDLF